MVSWLIFDLDHANPWIWDDKDLPTPNIIVTNRNNGHAHLFYAIVPVCTSENARSKPIQYMKAVYEAFASKLEADPSYSGPVAKTPGHPWWKTSELHNCVFELGELADYVDLAIKPYWSKGPDIESVSHSRHCMLFEELRFYSYSIVTTERESGSYSSFEKCLKSYAFNHNNFKSRGFSMNLTASQVEATVKCVARWSWDRYTGSSRCNLGVMQLDKSLSLVERQKLAALRTHQKRVESTELKIKAAYRNLLERGVKPSYVAIAKLANLSRQTVSKYKNILQEISQSKPTENVIDLAASTIKNENVKYATHQIPAGSSSIEYFDHVSLGRSCNSNINIFDVDEIASTRKYRKSKLKPPD